MKQFVMAARSTMPVPAGEYVPDYLCDAKCCSTQLDWAILVQSIQCTCNECIQFMTKFLLPALVDSLCFGNDLRKAVPNKRHPF